MLNIRDIIARVENPSMCTIEDIDDLRMMTEKFPYAPLFPILYLKALSNRKDIRFEEELSKYAFRISDRVQLYQLIHEAQTSRIQTDVIEIQTETVAEVIEIQKIDEEQKETAVSELSVVKENETEIEKTVEPILTVVEQIESDIEEEDDEEIIPLEIRSTANTEEEVINDTVQSENFEKEMIAETISSTFELTLKEEAEEELAPSEDVEKEPETEGQKSETTQIESIETHSKRSFSSWLRSNENNEQPLIDEEKARIDTILEQFLEKQPSISRPKKTENIEDRPKKEFYSAAKKAKESIQMDQMPVSETLARIFALQGNYPKAIFVYEQLLLINPEKKTFFATQIEDLKKKLTS